MARIVNLRPPVEVKKEPIVQQAPSTRPVELPKKESIPPSPTPVIVPAVSTIAQADFVWAAYPHQAPRSEKHITLFIACISALAAVVWYFQGNIIFGIFLLLAALTLAATGRREPKPVRVQVTAEGIKVEDTKHLFKNLKSFWVDYTPGGMKELSLEVDRWYLPYVKIPLGNQNPNHLRSFLLEFIPEQEHQPSLIEVLARSSGF